MAKDIIDRKLILELAKLLEQTGMSEIEIEAEGRRIKLSRQGGLVSAPATPAPAPAPHPQPQGAPEAKSAPPAAQAEEAGEMVRSPIVGTVYLSPEPGAAPFIKPGDKVTKGQSLLIVEAMKTMNHIPSTVAGIVREVLVTDGQPVEFDEPLVRIE